MGVRGALLDVDNTLVAPAGARVSEQVAAHLLSARRSSQIARWALATNARRDLTPLAAELDIPWIKAGRWVAKPRAAYYRRALAVIDLPAHQVAMIGDKALHDVIPATRLGLVTVLVEPQWPDQLIDRLLLRRRREARLAQRGNRRSFAMCRPRS